jgi:hypothetical protein
VAWSLKGQVVVACNCDYGCPCNFNARPTKGKCEGGWTWHVEQGHYDDVPLDSLNFSVYANWPGAIHEGGGEALILVDERADADQRGAISTLVGGDVGGPWGVLAWTWPRIHGPLAVPYDVDLAGLDTRVRAGDAVELALTPVKNPVTGVETRAGVRLPSGIIFKEGDLGASARFRVHDGIAYDHSGQYTAIGPFEYEGPPPDEG